MVLYKALALAWLACAVHCQYMGKREPNRSYYTLNVPEGKSGQDAAKHVARSLGVRFEGQVGQLETYYMVSAPDSLKRDEDPVVSQFHSFKKLAKRHDDVWHRVSRLDKQIAKKRVKRGPIPMDPKSALLDAQKALGINDPEFPTQWHLVRWWSIFGLIWCTYSI